MASLGEVTPLILSYNEEANIGRCLKSLEWAAQIVVVDSGSTDGTLKLIAEYPQARVVQRSFDSHSAQANFGLSLVTSRWVLSLDADYVLTPEFQRMIQAENFIWDESCVYFAPFRLCVRGRELRQSLYPPRAVLYARDSARYEQDGHTQRLSLNDRRQVLLPARLLHDDRKSFERWHESQYRYALLEAEKLGGDPPAKEAWPDRLRRTGWAAPLLIVPYVLLWKGLIFDGLPGLYYAGQRCYAELLLALLLLDRRFKED